MTKPMARLLRLIWACQVLYLTHASPPHRANNQPTPKEQDIFKNIAEITGSYLHSIKEEGGLVGKLGGYIQPKALPQGRNPIITDETPNIPYTAPPQREPSPDRPSNKNELKPSLANHNNHSTDHNHDYSNHRPPMGGKYPTSRPILYPGGTEGNVTTPLGAVGAGSGVTAAPAKMGLCLFCSCTANALDVTCSPSVENPDPKLTLSASLLPPNLKVLRVRGFDRVEVSPDTFAGSASPLKRVLFVHVKDLVLHKHSLFFAPNATKTMSVSVELRNCSVATFPEGALTQGIHVDHGPGGGGDPPSRQGKRYVSVHIDGCDIGHLESNAIHDARLYNFTLTHSRVGHMSPRALDVQVEDRAKFLANSLPPLPPGAICLHAKSSVFVGNRFGELKNRSILIETEGKVLFDGNTFPFLRAGALRGIDSREKYSASLDIRGNLLTRVEPGGLAVSPSFTSTSTFTFNNNKFAIKCDCNISSTFRSFLGALPSSDYFLRSSSCLEEEKAVVDGGEAKREEGEETPFPLPRPPPPPPSSSYIKIDAFLSASCSLSRVYLYSAIGASVFLLVVAVLVCLVCSRRVSRLQEAAALGHSPSLSFSTLNRHLGDPTTVSPHRPPCDGSPSGRGVGGGTFGSTSPSIWGVGIPELKTYQLNETAPFTEHADALSATLDRSGISNRGSYAPSFK